ncbi:MAG TPA: hypothetical protein VHT74_07030 [Acetobacteraceae bacterium]|jgi:hypothetical protein|nr:hypothetical protein [Acetobacteraceae bacterium]
MSQAMIKLNGGDLTALRPHLAFGPAAAAVADGCARITDALERLEAGGFLLEATRLVAHALPKREAVWWACMCAAHTAPADLPDADRRAREAAEDWVRQQGDKPRRAAWSLAEASGFGSPEAWTAVAAFWSGDSMAPEGQPAVPPAPHLAGAAVAGAVALAAIRGDVTRQQARLRRFLESGRNIAAGGPGRLPAETA